MAEEYTVEEIEGLLAGVPRGEYTHFMQEGPTMLRQLLDENKRLGVELSNRDEDVISAANQTAELRSALEVAQSGNQKLTALLESESQGRASTQQEREQYIRDVARVRKEAGSTAAEQMRAKAIEMVKERRKWYGESLFGPMPKMESATESEKRLVTLASANMARHTCDHLLDELAELELESLTLESGEADGSL
jgi:hypothetical protein